MVRDALHVPGRQPAGAGAAIAVDVLLGGAAEVDLDGAVGVRELPGGAEGEPRVGHLDLAPLFEGLTEDAVLVADAVADARHVHRRERVDEAGGEAAETTVAEAGLDLLGTQEIEVEAERRHGLLGDVSEVGGEQRVTHLAAQQVLGREVADHLRRVLTTTLRGAQPVGHEVAADGAGQREVLVGGRRALERDAGLEVEFVEERLGEAVDRALGADNGLGGPGARGLERRALDGAVESRGLVGEPACAGTIGRVVGHELSGGNRGRSGPLVRHFRS